MIPHKLSNGICSLNPGVERLTLGCEMEIDRRGKVLEHEIFEAVIRATERMTYDNVNRILVDNDEQVMQEYEKLVPLSPNMEATAEVSRRKRFARRAIASDSNAGKVLADEEGNASAALIVERSV